MRIYVISVVQTVLVEMMLASFALLMIAGELWAFWPESLLRGGSGDSHLFHVSGYGGLGYLYAFSMKQQCDPGSTKERIRSMYRQDPHACGKLPFLRSAGSGVEEAVES